MGIKTRGKNLPASVVARYSGRQPNLKCNICNRTFSYDKNLQKHMTLHSNTSVESCDTRMFDSAANDITSLRGETESNEHVVDMHLLKVSPVAVKKSNNVMAETSPKDQSSGNRLQNGIGDNENGFSEDQLLRDSCNDMNTRMILESSGSQSVHTVDVTASLAPMTVLAKENLKARTFVSPLIHPEVQMALSDPSPLLCDFCGRSFSNPGNFQQHRIMHTGEMPLKCYYCKCSFSEHAAWKEHLATHSKTNQIQKQHQEYIQYKEIQPLSDSNVSPQLSSLSTSHCTADAEAMLVKLNLGLNDKEVTNDNTISATEMAHVRSGRLEQLIEALTKEVAQSSVDVQGEKNPKGQSSAVPVNNAIKNLVILQTNSVPTGGVSSDKVFAEKTSLSSKQYQCHFCPRSFPRACHLTNHEKIHTRGKQNPSHASPLINSSSQPTLEESPLVFGEELVERSFMKPVENVIQDVAQSKEQMLSAVPDQSHLRVPVRQVGQQWSCDVCSKRCINESHLLQHQKIHVKRKRNNNRRCNLTVHQPQLSAKILSSQEEATTTTAFLQRPGANGTPIPDENTCCICRKRLDPLSEEKIIYGSPPNILCTACMHTNQISDKKCYPQPLRSSKNSSKNSLGKETNKTLQKKQFRKYKKSWFYGSKLKLTKSNETSQKFPFFCKLCKKTFPNKWTFWCHSQNHPPSKRTTFHLHNQNKYYFQRKEWLTVRDNHIFSCPDCDKSFKSFGGFCVHQRSHRTDFFACGQCNLRFFLKNSLKYHSLKCCKDSVLVSPASDSAELHDWDSTQSSIEESKLTPNQKPGHPEAETSVVKWECKTCGDHFDQALQLVQHYQADHTKSKPFQCPFCKQLCNNSEQALTHLSSHSNNKVIRVDEGSEPQIGSDYSTSNLNPNLICSICEKRLTSLEELKTHLYSHSDMSLPVQVKPTTDDVTVAEKNQCTLYNEASPQNNLEQQHLQVQGAEKVHRCEVCSKCFDHGYKLQAHRRIHDADSPYKCPHCNKSFSQNDVYKRHVQTHTHSYQCRVCSQRYSSSSDLELHQKESNHELHQKESNHHLNANCKVSASKRLPSPYTYKCDVCQKVVRNLKIHMRIHDPHPDTVYKCNVCPKTFLQSGNLKQHLMMHSGERPLRCEFCDKGFIHSSHLKRHRQTHTGERPHQCEYCQRSFAERAKLRMHLRTHTKEKPYTCDYKGCGKCFSLKSVLDAHQLLHTGERPHSCEECGRSFTQRCNLIAHRRIHTGERPFKCNICQRAFRNSSNLKDHERLHSDDRPFKCDLCSKVFKRSDYLAKHLSVHSNEQNARNGGKGKNGNKRKVFNHGGEQQQLEMANSSTMATGEVPNGSYLPSESSSVTLELTCNSSPSKANDKVKISSSLAVTSIENVGFEPLKTFSQEAVSPPGDFVSGSVLDGYSGCGTVENVIEIYTEQDSVSSQLSEDNVSELTNAMVDSQILSSGLNGLERYFQCHLCHKTFGSAQILGNHVLLHIQEKFESPADAAQQTEETDEASRRHSSGNTVTVESPKEAESDMKKAICETLHTGTTEKLLSQSASDEQSEISHKTLGHLSELTYYLTDYVKGDLEFQLIGNGPNLHLNSIRQTLKPSDGDKLDLGVEIKASLVTLIEFQTQSEQSSSLVTSDPFACLLCLFNSPTVDAFAKHICKHFSESGLTSASLETDLEANSLLGVSKKLPVMKETDQDDSLSENACVSITDSVHLPIEHELVPVSQQNVASVRHSALDDDDDADHLSLRTFDPHNVVITSSHQEIENTENNNSFCGRPQSSSPNDQYEDVVEKSNLKATEWPTKPGNLMSGFFQDSDNIVLGPKEDLSQAKVSKAVQAEGLFTIEQKGLFKIDTSLQPNENGDVKKKRSLPSTINLDSNSFEICLECKPGEKPFKCGICKKTFKKLKYVKDHIKLHVGKTSLVCEICGKVFRRAFNLKQHHKIHESKVEQPVIITLTAADPTKEQSANPKTNSNENNHQTLDKSNKNPLEGQAPYTCNICSKTFQFQTYLKQHLKIHTSLKPYVCEHCEMGFSQQAYLTKHRRVHTGEKPYKCGYCDKGFARSELLTRHTRTHTKEKPYSCQHCSQTFALYNTLKRHVRTHTGQKPFQCGECGQAFTQRGNLSIHMRLHTGDRPFKCDKCQAGFIHSSNLKKHLKSCSQN